MSSGIMRLAKVKAKKSLVYIDLPYEIRVKMFYQDYKKRAELLDSIMPFEKLNGGNGNGNKRSD